MLIRATIKKKGGTILITEVVHRKDVLPASLYRIVDAALTSRRGHEVE
jgi:hypothetical protein